MGRNNNDNDASDGPSASGAIYVKGYERSTGHVSGYWKNSDNKRINSMEVSSDSKSHHVLSKKSGTVHMRETFNYEDNIKNGISPSTPTLRMVVWDYDTPRWPTGVLTDDAFHDDGDIQTIEGEKAREIAKTIFGLDYDPEKYSIRSGHILIHTKYGDVSGTFYYIENFAGDNAFTNDVVYNVEYPKELDAIIAKRDMRLNAAANTNTTDDALMMLSTDNDDSVRAKVAGNKNTPIVILEKLASDKHPDVREGVADNPNTPPAILEKLASDNDMLVRLKCAENNSTPVATLERLANDDMEGVRWSIARNASTSTATLEKLADDEHPDVREGAATNPNTPPVILEKLASDNDKFVREAAISSRAGRRAR